MPGFAPRPEPEYARLPSLVVWRYSTWRMYKTTKTLARSPGNNRLRSRRKRARARGVAEGIAQAHAEDAYNAAHCKPLGKSGDFFFPWPSQPLAMSCAPVAVPLDTEAPVARGFRRLHARGV